MEYNLLLKKFRIEKNLSQDDLAALSGYSQTYISALERGIKSPTLRIIVHLCKVLKVCPHLMVQYDKDCENDCTDKCDKRK